MQGGPTLLHQTTLVLPQDPSPNLIAEHIYYIDLAYLYFGVECVGGGDRGHGPVATGARRVEGRGAVQHGRHLETHTHRARHEEESVRERRAGEHLQPSTHGYRGRYLHASTLQHTHGPPAAQTTCASPIPPRTPHSLRYET